MVHVNRNSTHRGGEMKKAGITSKARGLFERPAGSGCWWINYYVDGKQHREKVGRPGMHLPFIRNGKLMHDAS